MREIDFQAMRRLPLFCDVAPAHVETLLRNAFLQRFPPQVDLVREHDPADFLHVVVEGEVEVFSTYRDRETTVAVLGPGKSFIVAAVLLDRIYLKSVRTMTMARILMIPADCVRAVFGVDAVFSRALGLELALAYRSIVKELKNQKLRSSLERLANWLLIHNAETGATGRFSLPFEKKILASRLGMAPEALSRAFAALIPYHVVVEGATITLNDALALEKLAQPSATIDDPMK